MLLLHDGVRFPRQCLSASCTSSANRQQHVFLYRMLRNKTAIRCTNITHGYDARVITAGMRIHRQLLLPSIESCSKWVAVHLYPQIIAHGLSGIDSRWNVMAHSDAWEGNGKGNWRMEWVAITLHTTSEYGVSTITTANGHTSAASSRLNWRPRRFAERQNLVSTRVPSHFNWPVLLYIQQPLTYPLYRAVSFLRS